MHKTYDPKSIVQPGPTYHHGMEIVPGSRTLHISGQIGVDRHGHVGSTVREQADIAFANVHAILEAAGMRLENLVRIRCFLIDVADIEVLKASRAAFLGEARPTSSLLIVKALGDPSWSVEVEAIAASFA